MAMRLIPVFTCWNWEEREVCAEVCAKVCAKVCVCVCVCVCVQV